MIKRFENGRDGRPMCRINGVISLPKQGYSVQSGDECEVEIISTNQRGTVNFLKVTKVISTIISRQNAEDEITLAQSKVKSYNSEGGLFEMKYFAWLEFFNKIAKVIITRHVGEKTISSHLACPKCGQKVVSVTARDIAFNELYVYEKCGSCQWNNDEGGYKKVWVDGVFNKAGYDFSNGGFTGACEDGHWTTVLVTGEPAIYVEAYESPAKMCEYKRYPFPFPLDDYIPNKMSKTSKPGIHTKRYDRKDLPGVVKSLEDCPMPPIDFQISYNESSDEIWNRLVNLTKNV